MSLTHIRVSKAYPALTSQLRTARRVAQIRLQLRYKRRAQLEECTLHSKSNIRPGVCHHHYKHPSCDFFARLFVAAKFLQRCMSSLMQNIFVSLPTRPDRRHGLDVLQPSACAANGGRRARSTGRQQRHRAHDRRTVDHAERAGGAGRCAGQQHQSGRTGVRVHHVQVSGSGVVGGVLRV